MQSGPWSACIKVTSAARDFWTDVGAAFDACVHMTSEPVSRQVADGQNVSFPFFMAFNSLLNNMELIKRIYLQASNGSRTTEVTKGG